MMKKLCRTALICLPLALSACAVSPSYGPALSSSDTGYRDQKIESDRFRITYKSRDLDAADDGALRRAAEVTIAEGRTYFDVVNRSVDQADGRGFRPSIGIGGSTGNRRYGSRVGVGISLPLGESSGPKTIQLEIQLKDSPAPDNPRRYNARQVLESLVGPTAG